MIDVAYAGVHQAFQLALAAHELGALRTFHCSVFDAPGRWGGLLSRLAGREAMRSRRLEGLPADRVVEHPFPLLGKLLRDRIFPASRGDWIATNDRFDRQVAKVLAKAPPDVFIGTETCDLHCLEACEKAGTIRIHDCPQLHPAYLDRLMLEASSLAGVKLPKGPEWPEMRARVLREYDKAQHLLIFSAIHRRSFESAGFAPERLFERPLWVDTAFWRRHEGETPLAPQRPLRLLFAGALNLRKGVPFLLEALKLLGGGFTLTLAGPASTQVSIPEAVGGCVIRRVGSLPKHLLRQAYVEHDLFVLPSIADSFGFVALEAMACGLPAILTDNCGAPLPDESWRVPAMDARALAERLAWYLDEPQRAQEHSVIASAFARQFTPERYREGIRTLLRRVSDPPSPRAQQQETRNDAQVGQYDSQPRR